MNSFTFFWIREAYKKVEQLGDRLPEITKLVEGDIQEALEEIYNNKTEKGGRIISMLF